MNLFQSGSIKQSISIKIIVLLISLFMFYDAFAKTVVNKTGSGAIDWSNGVIYAVGYGPVPENLRGKAKGKLFARRVAIVDAYRNLAETTQGVKVTSETTVVDSMKRSRVIKTKVSALIKGAQVVSEKFAGGMFSVKLALPISGRFMKTIIPRETFKKLIRVNQFSQNRYNIPWEKLLNILPISSAHADINTIPDIDFYNKTERETVKKLIKWLDPMSNQSAGIEKLKATVQHYEQKTVYTGIILDASHLVDFEMATVPMLKTNDGKLIYPNPQTSYDNVVKHRLVSYDFDLKDATENPRVALHPMVIKADSLYKSKLSDIIISDDDAKLISSIASANQNLNKARVMIIVAE
jgi:hypothetical protein